MRLANIALDSKSVINLSSRSIPPEAIVVLAKRIGFVLTTSNHLQTKVDANTAMAKLCSKTRSLIKSSDPEISTSLEPELDDIGFDLPNNLKLPFHSTPASSENPLVNGSWFS